MLRPMLGGLAALAALAFAGPANAVMIDVDLPVIDEFTESATVWNLPFLASDSLIQDAPRGAVGDRRLSVQAAEGNWDRLSILQINRGNALFMTIGQDAIFTLEYGVSQPLNLALPGDAFKFNILASDLDDRGLTAAFRTTLGSGEGILEMATILLAGEGSYVIPFSLFPLTNFEDVDYIAFALDTTGVYGSHVLIDAIVDPELPEPSTIALFGVGLLGLARLAHRRKH